MITEILQYKCRAKSHVNQKAPSFVVLLLLKQYSLHSATSTQSASACRNMQNEKIKYFLVHVPPHLKYFGFHYKIDEDEFVINFKPTENSIPDSKQETKTSFDYSVSHKHKNKKFVPNELDLF